MPADDELHLARTNAEAHVFLSLQPCPSCGETRGDYRSSVIRVGRDLASRYTAVCPRCGDERVYRFRIPEEILHAPAGQVVFGGDEPSQLLDPGQWLEYADDRARRVPATRTGLDPEQRRGARHALVTAIAAIDEVLKFAPPGAETVPVSAFTSPAGRAALEREPGRFDTARLHAVRDTYTRRLPQWRG